MQKQDHEYVGEYQVREIILRPYLIESYPPFHTSTWHGGTRDVSFIPVGVLEELIKRGYMKKDGTQNSSPTVEKFMEFMRKWNKKGIDVRAYGYEISGRRSDVRITIEGLVIPPAQPVPFKPDSLWKEFAEDWNAVNRGADELNDRRSWWD